MFPQTDIASVISTRVSVAPQTATTSTTGSTIDRAGFLSAELWAYVTSVTASTTVITKLQHGDASNGSDAADYTDPTTGLVPTLTTFTSADTSKMYRKAVNLNGAKQYITVVQTIAGGSPSVPTCAGVTLGGHYQNPQD